MHRRSGDHKGSPLQDTHRKEAREPSATPYPRRPCTADRATKRDHPYKTPAGERRGNHVRLRIRAAHAPPIWRPQGISPTRHPQERGAGIMYDCVSAPPMHRRSGDHKGSPLQDTRRREAREPCTTTYPRRPCTADRATTRDRPYKTPVGKRRGNRVRHRIPAAHAPPIGRPKGITPTRHPPERGAEITVWCHLPLLAIDGGGIVPAAFFASLAHGGSTG